MKTLIAYYSRTGITKKVATALAEKLKADIEEIVDLTSRKGPMGWLSGGRDAMKKALTSIEKPKNDPSKYDVVIVGTPIWASNMAPAVRTYLTDHKPGKKAAVFCTMGNMGDKQAFAGMKELMPGTDVIAELTLTSKQVLSNDLGAMDAFAEKIKKSK